MMVVVGPQGQYEWSNRRCGTSKTWGGAFMCFWTLASWQAMHVFTHRATCLRTPFHTYLSVMSFCIAQMEGCDRLCTTSNTVLRKLLGTIGLGWPVDVSQRSVVPAGPNGMSWGDNPESAVMWVANSWSSCCAAAMQ